MMHGHEKSDLVIVAMKPANKAREARRGGVCGGGRSGVGGAKGGGQGEYAPAKHVLDSEPGSRVTGAGAYSATCAVTHRGCAGSGAGAQPCIIAHALLRWRSADRRCARGPGNRVAL